ncbi:MAG TPA: 23S rRNA (adenine(2503)-C(2))-methyltransferase RlmN [Bacteriovoracaceae bacterium]|nr:23S rRNA (adenine(2503)-C(2))-methyltransferase RlmN [Bacteriovoracaceae bacterium]
MENTSAYSLTRDDWNELLRQENQSPHALSYLLDGLYRDRAVWGRHLSNHLLKTLAERFDLTLPLISQVLESPDGTVKFQVRFADGLEVETVLIPFHKRYTVCLSTQVGCLMNCSFCYTGTQGFKRNLSAQEIVGQYLLAMNWLKGHKKPSIVFMGQGEPLHNADEVLRATRIFNDPQLLDLGVRQMTLSTVGYLPGFEALARFPQINLALSLHSPFDEERSRLIPVNQKFPLRAVFERLEDLEILRRKILTVEYLMIDGFNLSLAHVDALTELLRDRRAVVNLIPFNPFPGSDWKRPAPEKILEFRNMLVAKKLRVTLRATKGDDILAACGQLKINKLARNYESGT